MTKWNRPREARTPSRIRAIALLGALSCSASWSISANAATATCESLTSLTLPNATITSAQSIPAGTYTPPGFGPITNLPAFCRVVGVIRPTSDSSIGFEVWMPKSGWNHRFTQIGNGGLAGTYALMYSSTSSMMQRGYAIAGTDDGHTATDPASWPIGHPEKVKDLAWRAVHETSVASKQVIASFYGTEARYSYFQGCSTGGKEAFMEAQRFPEDFDGIIGGAAAMRYTDLIARFVWDEQAQLNDPAGYIPTSKLPAIQRAALNACDTVDGIADGVVNDPRQCRFDPGVLQCPGADNASCLTAPQVSALRKIYSGPVNPRTGEKIIFGYEPSGENSFGTQTWTAYIAGANGPTSAAQYTVMNSFNKYLVFEDPNWDFRTFDFDTGVTQMHQKLDPVPFDATSADLSRFQERGGKLLQYHGWIDYSVSPLESIDYYERVLATHTPGKGNGRGERDVAIRRTQDFYRLFMAPGMNHCAGGDGPNAFGQILSYGLISNTPPPSHDADHDIVTALENWVEKGIAPEKLIATKYTSDDPTKGIQMQRPLCPYPQKARFKGQGSGSSNSAESFTCEVDEDDRGRNSQ
ncbi:tannase/feruloyl esterase family alpha/beta hydrolase [Variovorax ureilyticus]|uniref:Tannase/feruloyl esterase family alpha/beta hydrolase n=1 Tax=Variovorax ureilyticus TaxID=1836198 RepID=A0ABU8VL50_9BURK